MEASKLSGAKRKKGPLHCDVCDVSVTCEIGSHAHLNGKKHKAKEGLSADGGELKIAEKAGKKLYCEICEVECNGEATMEKHLKGKKHRGKALTEDDIRSGEKKRRVGFWCGICKLGCNSEAMMQVHIGGKKHKEKAAKKSRADAKAARIKQGACRGTCEEAKEEMIEGEIDEEEMKEAEIEGEVREKEIKEVEHEEEVKGEDEKIDGEINEEEMREAEIEGEVKENEIKELEHKEEEKEGFKEVNIKEGAKDEDRYLIGWCISDIDKAEKVDLRTVNEEEDEEEIKKEAYDETKDEDGTKDPKDCCCISNGKAANETEITEGEDKVAMIKEEEIEEDEGKEKKNEEKEYQNQKDVGLWCKICNVKCNSMAVMAGHYKGKKHKAKEAKLGLIKENEENEREQEKKLQELKAEKNKEFWCLICKVKCDSQAMIAKHLRGSEHKEKISRRWGKQQAKQEAKKE